MENQPVTNPSDISSVTPSPINQPPIPPQTKTNLMMPVVITLLISAVIFGFGGYYFGKQSLTTQKVAENIQTSPTPTSSPVLSPTVAPTGSDSITSFKTYKGTIYPYQVTYPVEFIYENKDVTSEIERAVFNNSKSDQTLTSFMIYVLKGKLPDPSKIYIDKTGDQKLTGKYILAGTEGIYIELPNGQGGGEEAQIPRTEVYIERNGILYSFDFFGVSSSKNETINQVLSSFKFTN